MPENASPADSHGPPKGKKPLPEAAGDAKNVKDSKKKSVSKSDPDPLPRAKVRDKHTPSPGKALTGTAAESGGARREVDKDAFKAEALARTPADNADSSSAKAAASESGTAGEKSDPARTPRDGHRFSGAKNGALVDSVGADDSDLGSADPEVAGAAAAAAAEAAGLPELPNLPDVEPTEDERFYAMCAWLSAAALVLAMVCPFYFVGPLLYWLRFRTRSRFVAFHAKQALWWSLPATLVIWGWGLAAGLVLGGTFGWQFAGLNLFTLVPLQVAVIVWFAWISLKALQGVKYRTPIVGRLADAAPQKWV